MAKLGRQMRRALQALLLGGQLAYAGFAYADDVADEADLHFQIGAERYRASDYRGALEHFLASNRLAANRNVSFNIARSYEQLKSYPEAFRYYAQALDGETDLDMRRRVELALENVKPRVALLRVVTDPPGADIFIDRRELGSRGTSPRLLALPPGRYRVIAEMAEHERGESAEIDVRAATETPVSLALTPTMAGQSGDLVVNADETGALIEIDGRPRAFTPAILSLAAGAHRMRVSLPGYRAIEQPFDIHPKQDTKLDIALTQAEEVIAASRVSEAVEDAPSSVSVVRSEELRAMAYPTIAEALRGVRGVYVSDDRSYATLGFRGLNPLGLYGNHVLVLVDGQPTNDDWVGSSYVGYDARTDLDDIARIEVVRGPGSVLYGTNAVSGVVNLVTRDVEAKSSAEVGVSTQEYGIARARARANVRLSPEATLWTSVAVAKGQGRDFYFPEFADVPRVAGAARGLDGFRSATLNGRLTWRHFTVQWLAHARDKQMPTAQFGTTFGDPGLHQLDTRGLVEVRFEPALSESVQLLSRAHLNYYGFRGHYPYPQQDGGEQLDTYDGSWAGLEQRIVWTPWARVRVTGGAEAQAHYLVHQTITDDSGSALDDRHPYQVFAGYGLADVALSSRVSLNGGARVDRYSTFGSSINPRAALIVRPYDAGNLKIMAGKAFRAPSVYELYYNDGGATQVPSPDLRPESIYSGEVEFSHRLSPTVSTTAALFGNVARDLIVQRGAGSADEPLRYENSSAPVWIVGGELEVRREWHRGWMLSASYSVQHARYLPNASFSSILGSRDDAALRRVPNAPEHLASFRAAVPLLGRALLAATRLSLESSRFDRNDRALDADPQRSTNSAAVWDLVLSGQEPRWNLQYAVGAYNLFDWRYNLPLSREFAPTSLRQNGRTLLASVGVTF